MLLLREAEGEKAPEVLQENSQDRTFGLQEGRNLFRKIAERAKASSAGGIDAGVAKDALAGVFDGLNMCVIQLVGKDKSPVLSRISIVLDDAFTEISKIK